MLASRYKYQHTDRQAYVPYSLPYIYISINILINHKYHIEINDI